MSSDPSVFRIWVRVISRLVLPKLVFFMEEQYNFSCPEKPVRMKKLTARNFSVATDEAALRQYETNTLNKST